MMKFNAVVPAWLIALLAAMATVIVVISVAHDKEVRLWHGAPGTELQITR